MRALVLGICIALAAVAAMLLAAPAREITEEGARQAHVDFGRPIVATFGGQQAAIFFAEAKDAGEATWIAQAGEEPFVQAVYWEDGDFAGAGNRGQIRKALDERLSVAGLQTQKRTGAFPPAGRCAVVAAAGAMPEKIADAVLGGSFPQDGQMLIYAGLADGSQIGEGGRVSSNPGLARALGGGVENADGSIGLAAPAGGEIIIYPKVPEEYDGAMLAGKIARQIMLSKKGVDAEAAARITEGKGAIALALPFNKSYFRVAALRQNEILKEEYFGPEYALPGEISGGKEAADGAVYRISSDLGKAGSQELEMHVVAYDASGNVAWKKQVGVSNASQLFVGAAKIDGWPKSRWAILALQDQYGRKFAQGFVMIPSLEAKLVYDGGREKEFLILKNGEPLGESSVMVRRGGGQWAEVAAGEGKALISSKWAPGKNTLEFESNGARAEYSFEENGGQLAFYLRWGAPALALAAIFIFALAPKEQKKYTIRCGCANSPGRGEIRMGAPSLEAMVRRAQADLGHNALSEREINRCLFAQTGMLASDGSLKNALRALVKNGALVEYGGYYTAAEKNRTAAGGKTQGGDYGAGAGKGGVGGVRAIALSRRLSDCLLQRGLRAVEKNGALVSGKGKSAQAWALDTGGLMMLLKKFPAIALVFESREEEEKWLDGISFGRKEDSQIALALKSGKLCTFVLPK